MSGESLVQFKPNDLTKMVQEITMSMQQLNS